MGSTKLRWRTGDRGWRRRRILRFVQDFGQREGHPPSYREIAGALGLAVSTVSYEVSVLERNGSMRRRPG
jgi:repressor LexA